MIAGPGTIATVLLLVNLSRGDRVELSVVALPMRVALFVTWLCMRGSSWLLRRHRHDGNSCRHAAARNHSGGARRAVRAQRARPNAVVTALKRAVSRPTADRRTFSIGGICASAGSLNPSIGSGNGIGCGGSLNGSAPGSKQNGQKMLPLSVAPSGYVYS